jgi:diguanylate cyclase (GGDEF)-like protein
MVTKNPDSLKWPRVWLYPLLGTAFALGAPGGLLCVRAGANGTWPSPAWVVHEVAGDPILYAYLSVSTAAAFAIIGRVLGARADDLRILSNTDPLTGLVNRRALHGRLVEEMARVERHGKPATLLLIDLDGLKRINDRQGHRVGDAALCALASALHECSRESDLVARVGGDEFVVLAAETKADEALALAGRIRDYLLRGTEASPALTVSIGVSEARRGDSLSPERLLSQADEALYAAKNGGGNRTVLSTRLASTRYHDRAGRPAPEHQA